MEHMLSGQQHGFGFFLSIFANMNGIKVRNKQMLYYRVTTLNLYTFLFALKLLYLASNEA